MRDLNRPLPIHPADCRCARCQPHMPGSHRLYPEHGLVALIVAAAFVAAVLAILGAN